MKILCDVCTQEEASLLCVADEAVLCAACDSAVHCANKLAGKHHRLALRSPPSDKPPLCDICKEKRAFLFCREDRAILCKDCDSQIHKANEMTKKHVRFLLTGVGIETSPESVANPKRKRSPPPATGSTSSISEYFINTLPGWRVDDFLDSCSCQTFKVAREEAKDPFWAYDHQPTQNQIQIPEMMGFKEKDQHLIENEDHLFAVPQISPASCKRAFW